ncbi:MAG: hypothetical protein P8X55_13860, partial [Desulfosarcinaceae bacterium]
EAKTAEAPPFDPDLPDGEHPAEAQNDYPILKEIEDNETVDPPAPKDKPKQGKKGGGETTPLRSPGRGFRWCLTTAAILTVLAALSWGGYWVYDNYFDQVRSRLFAEKATKQSPNNAAPAPSAPSSPDVNSAPRPAAVPASPRALPAPDSQAVNLDGLTAELTAARREILSKITEIQDLKAYYQKGIEEEEAKIEARFAGSRLPSLSLAVADPKIELSLKSVQRRSAYIERIQTPLDILFSASEQLLFLQRRTQMYNVLVGYVSGFPVLDYQSEVRQILNKHLEEVRGLSVDEIDATSKDLASIWAAIEADLRAKAARKQAYVLSNQKDRAISREICSGNFDQKYLLTVLNPDTAHCLVQWNGKDLYLNGLTQLSPEVAGILAQWPGEWMSLNGLKELPSQAAEQLSKWRGKRLSLNGLTRLSAKATDYLSKWKGEQLELIGLQSMGRWENYGTRLYLSEKLQRQLEGR